MSNVLTRLLALQELDTLIAQLHHRLEHLPEQAAVEAVRHHRAENAAAVADVQQQRASRLQRQEQLEAEIAGIEARITEIDTALYSGTVKAPKDLLAMQEEIEHLKQRRTPLEDEVLALMEELEPLDATLASLMAADDALQADEAAARLALSAAAAGADEELADATIRRAEELDGIDLTLLATYDRLRAQLSGVAVARFVGGSCHGCHLVLPAVETDRIRHEPADAVVLCPECGRILVR